MLTMTKDTKNIIFSLLILLTHFYSYSQFVINGSARETAPGEYTLTEAKNGQVGTIWSEQKISLNDAFEIELELYFGTKDGNGADGITFSLQPKSNTVGVSGGGLGIGGITPSLITEMDTYSNGSYGDPSYDHIALVKNTVSHKGADNLVTPTQIVNGKNNVEDGGWYNFKATWDPANQVYQVYVNGLQRFSYEGDIINTVFKGQADVFWGFTSSTGGANNDQKVRIINTTIIDLFDCTETPNDKTFCDASGPASVTLDFSNAQPDATYEWFDTKDRDNLLGTGLTYTDNAVTEEKDYYVLATFPEVVNTGGTVNLSPSGSTGFIDQTYLWDGNNRSFIVETDLIIKSVDVVLPTYDGGCFQQGTTLTNTIDILNNGGTTVASANITGVCGETSTVILNASLNPGSYTMKFRTYQNHTFKVTSDGSPKSIAGVITLEDNTIVTQWETKRFSGNFFNWKIETAGGTGTAECLFSVKTEKVCPECSTFPSVSIGTGFTYCSENDTTIEATTSATNVLWSTNETTNKIIVGEGTYTVEVWDDPNCSSFDNIIVNRECPSEPIELLPDTIELCSGVTDTIRASNIEPGSNWAGTDLFTPINDSMVSISLQNDAKYYVTNYVRLNILSDNIDFEDPKITSGFKIMNADLVPGWETTNSKNKVELWQSGFQGVPSYKGNQFMELNADEDAALFQEMTTVPGEVIGINLAHRGRGGIDEMQLLAGPIGGPFTVVNNYLDGTTAWGFYSEYYTVPPGQTTTVFMFETVSCNGGACGGSGNFLDAIEFFKVEQQTDSVFVKILPSPTLNLGNSQLICEEDTVILNAGNLGFDYDWSIKKKTQEIKITESGTYSVRVYADGCETSSDVDITVQTKPIVDLGDDIVVCQGTTITLDAQNTGLDFKWNSTDITQTLNPVITGEYSVIVTDVLGCEGKDTAQVVIHPLPSVNLGNDTTICEGDSLLIDAKNIGFNYNWNTSEATQIIKVKTAGNYEVTISGDGTGCSDIGTIKVSIQSLPVVDLGSDIEVCEGTVTTLNAKNVGHTFSWNTGESTQEIKITNSDTLDIKVTDNLGCTGLDTIIVTIHPQPDVNLGNDTIICEGESLLIDAQIDGFVYAWSNIKVSKSIKIGENGIYEVTVTDSSGTCSDTDDKEVIIQSLPVVELGKDTSLCEGEVLQLDAKNIGLDYEWSTVETSQTIDVNSSNTYSLIVTDAIGCEGKDTIEVTVNTMPLVDLDDQVTICEGETLTLDAENLGFEYNWSTTESTQKIEVTTAGKYGVEVFKVGTRCSDKDTIEIIVQAKPLVNLGDDKSLCIGEKTTLDAGNIGLDYLWNTNAATQEIVVDETGTYSVKVTDALGCLGNSKILVTVHDLPKINIEAPTDICLFDDVVSIRTSPIGGDLTGNGIKQSTFDPLASEVVTGVQNKLTYTYTDINNCTSQENISITVHLEPIVPQNLSDTILCEGESTEYQIDVSGALEYSWIDENGIVVEIDNRFSIDQDGLYQVNVSNEFCSALSNQFSVEVVNPEINAYVNPEVPILLGESAELLIENPNVDYQYNWKLEESSIGDGTSLEVKPTETTIYEVTATIYNCTATTTLEVEVIQPIIIPSMFTPNGDGLNDYWEITGLDRDFYFELKVYNRWGTVVFKAYEYSNMWDGTTNGNLIPSAVYYYVIEVGDNNKETLQGSVTIMR